MFSGDHLLPKTPGSEVMTWSWKQKLVGVSRTCRISWKIMKIWEILMRHLMRHFDETLWWDILWHILMRHFDETFWWYIMMRHFNETFWWEILMWHFDVTFWWNILVIHLLKSKTKKTKNVYIFWWDILMRHFLKIFW